MKNEQLSLTNLFNHYIDLIDYFHLIFIHLNSQIPIVYT